MPGIELGDEIEGQHRVLRREKWTGKTHEEYRSEEVDPKRRRESGEKDSIRRVEKRADLVEHRVKFRIAEDGL